MRETWKDKYMDRPWQDLRHVLRKSFYNKIHGNLLSWHVTNPTQSEFEPQIAEPIPNKKSTPGPNYLISYIGRLLCDSRFKIWSCGIRYIPCKQVTVNLILTLKKAGGGSYVPAAQEIACHFLQDHARVLTLLNFFKNDVRPRVKESFWAYLNISLMCCMPL